MLKQLGIEIVKLDLPFRLNHVNCFMAEGESGWTIIDAGLNNAYTKARWEKKIKGENIKSLFLTHSHPDHFGHAGELQIKKNAEVSMTKEGVESSFTDENIGRLHGNYKMAVDPIEMADFMVSNTSEFKTLTKPHPTINHYFEEGQKVSIGAYKYEIIVTPGHSE